MRAKLLLLGAMGLTFAAVMSGACGGNVVVDGNSGSGAGAGGSMPSNGVGGAPTQIVCADLGDDCTQDSDCCSFDCDTTSSICAAPTLTCVFDNDACTADSDCCSNVCDTDGFYADGFCGE
jgi:hypothetical protein